MKHKFDIIVVGGGLAGLAAAAVLNEGGQLVGVVDEPPQHGSNLGGYAPISGTKFSFPPAGSGLIAQARSPKRLSYAYRDAAARLRLTASSETPPGVEDSAKTDVDIGRGIRFRSYDCVLVSRSELEATISMIAEPIELQHMVVRGRCSSLAYSDSGWRCEVNAAGCSRRVLNAESLILATGRSAHPPGLPIRSEARWRGIDIGVRLEFPISGLRGLRALGNDPKLLRGRVRTFCLNYPGSVFWYPVGGFMVSGGKSEEKPCGLANVGLLRRCPPEESADIVEHLVSTLGGQRNAPRFSAKVTGSLGGTVAASLSRLFGKTVVSEVGDFLVDLGSLGLVDLSEGYTVHAPLLDWHWPILGQPNSSQGDAPSLWVAGDVAGHARGLLQAATSGILAAWDCLER